MLSRTTIVLFIAVFALQAAQVVKTYPGNDAPLAERLKWAAGEAESADSNPPLWVGYSIKRLMAKNEYIGSFYDERQGHSLQDIIEGKIAPEASNSGGKNGHRVSLGGSDQDTPEKDLREVAFLFRVDRFNGDRFKATELEMNNLELPFDLESLSLLWLGPVSGEESQKFLIDLFGQPGTVEFREDLISAVGLHEKTPGGYKFLKDVIASTEPDDIREGAVFWITRQDNPEILDLLFKTARNDRSEDIREHAVFAIHLLDSDAAVDRLIELARTGSDAEVREKAVFWLGQVASEKVLPALNDLVFNDAETELQNQAVFALSQIESEDALNSLIRVAQSHPNPQVRKKAIFWLGQSEDERALDALVQFIKQR